jgi:hypothetical protein
MARSDEDDRALAALGVALLEDKPPASISA